MGTVPFEQGLDEPDACAIRIAHTMKRVLLLIGVLVLAAAPAARAEPAHVGWPSSIEALGDSGSTGFNSGPTPSRSRRAAERVGDGATTPR